MQSSLASPRMEVEPAPATSLFESTTLFNYVKVAIALNCKPIYIKDNLLRVTFPGFKCFLPKYFDLDKNILLKSDVLINLKDYSEYSAEMTYSLHALIRLSNKDIIRISTMGKDPRYLRSLNIRRFDKQCQYHESYRFVLSSLSDKAPDQARWESGVDSQYGSCMLQTEVFSDQDHLAILSRQSGCFHLMACSEFNHFSVEFPKSAGSFFPYFGILGDKQLVCSAVYREEASAEKKDGIFLIDVDLVSKTFKPIEKPVLILSKESIAGINGLTASVFMLTTRKAEKEELSCYKIIAGDAKQISTLQGTTLPMAQEKMATGEVIFWDVNTKFITIFNPFKCQKIEVQKVEKVDQIFLCGDREVMILADKKFIRCHVPSYAPKEEVVDVHKLGSGPPVRFHYLHTTRRSFSVFSERKDQSDKKEMPSLKI